MEVYPGLLAVAVTAIRASAISGVTTSVGPTCSGTNPPRQR